jgi:membrane-associated protease RseP (regulator of RpoE activity)
MAEEGALSPSTTPIVDEETAPVDAAPAASAAPTPPLDLEARIVSSDATHYEIDHDVVILALLGGINGELRATHRPAGGYALDGIAPGSLFARLGLGSGDIVHAINEVTLTSPGSLKAAYAEMRTSRALDVVVERAGVRMTIRYELAKRPRPGSALSAHSPFISPGTSDETLGPDEVAAGIREIDATTWEIDRELLLKLIADPGLLARSARVLPHMKEGEVLGYKIFGVRPGGVLYRLGFKNGDLFLTLGDTSLVTPDGALEAFVRLREAKDFNVTIERRGATATLHYRIVG